MSNFSFIQISDHHLGRSEHTLRKGFLPAYAFRAVMRDIAEKWVHKIDFIVSTGDLVLGGTAAEYENVCRMLGLAKVSPAPGPQLVSIEGLQDFPMYFLPGNHDDVFQFSKELFGHAPAGERLHLSFQHKGIHFVSPDWGPEEPGGIAPDTPDDLIDWLEMTLTDKEPTILLLHYAPGLLPGCWKEDMVPRNIDRFWEVLSARDKVLGVFVGHIHQNFETEIRGQNVFGVASTCYQQILHEGQYVRALLPLAYRVVTIEEDRLRTQVCEVDLPLGRKHELSG